MSERIDLTGQKFNMLTVLGYHETINGNAVWKCQCDCGNTTYVRGGNLKNGSVKSCGCLLHLPAHNRTHGMSDSRLYGIWAGIKNRARGNNIKPYNDSSYDGITVCDDWKNSFENFRDWSMSHGYSDELTIDRIDNYGNYTPENCRWTDMHTQALNRRCAHLISYNGKTQTLTEWCEELGLDYKRTHNRLVKNHWSPDRAFTEPVNIDWRNMETRRKAEINGL